MNKHLRGISDDLLAALQKLADGHKRSLNSEILVALQLYVDKSQKGVSVKHTEQEQLVIYAKQIAVYRGYTDLVDGLQPLQALQEKYFHEIEEFKEALAHKTWLHALHESSDTLYYAACIHAQGGSDLYPDALRESAQLLRFHGIRMSSAQIEAAALAKYGWRAAGKDNKDEAHELALIERAVQK